MNTRRILGRGYSTIRASTFVSRTALTASTNIFLAVVGVATGILAARLLGTEGRGHLAAIQLWPSFIATLAMLGLPESLVYFSARDATRSGERLASAVTLALMAAVPFGVAGYLLMPLLLSPQPLQVIHSARTYLLIIPIFALVGMLYHPLRGRGHFLAWNLLRTMPSVGWLLLLLFSAGASVSAHQLAARYLLILGVLIIPVTWTVRKLLPGPYVPRRELFGPLVAYGLPNAATTVPQALNLRLDQMIIAGLFPADALGLYVVAVAWGNATQPLLSAIGTVLFPSVASRAGSERRSHAFMQGLHLAVLVGLALCGVLVLAAPWVLPFFFGAEFSAAVPSAQVMTVAGALWGVNLVIEEGMRGLGRPGAVLRAEIGGLITTAIALVLLLPILELIGAALASVLGYASVTALLLRSSSAQTGLPVRSLMRPDPRALSESLRSALNRSSVGRKKDAISDEGQATSAETSIARNTPDA
jgi:O-antigen/teichoic acid export membrane protein